MQQAARVNVGCVLSASIWLARKASAVIRNVSQQGIEITQKGKDGVDDPMTQADLAAQELIIGGLQSVFPGLSIVGEEDTPEVATAKEKPALDLLDAARIPADLQDVPLADVCVFIDPLDATKEFTLGHTWCVMTLIGITVNGTPVAGVMHQPFEGGTEGHSVYALRGYGVTGLEKKERRGTGLVVVTTASHSTPALDEVLQRVAPDTLLREGGCGYKALLVARGEADCYLYPQPGTKRWDSCAPEAVLRELGGVLTDRNGADIVYAKSGDMLNLSLVASMDAQLHARIIAALSADGSGAKI